MIRRIVIVSDAWHPQVNGVVRTLVTIIRILNARGIEVSVIEPTKFKTVPFPLYPEIPLAFFPRRRLAQLLREAKPDAVHITTEGPLGLSARAECLARGIPFTTSYHTHFQLYLEAWIGDGILTRIAYGYLRWFHSVAKATLVATKSLGDELTVHGFKNIVLWPLGVDTELFKKSMRPAGDSLASPVFAYCGRLAREKGVDEFLKLSLPGTKLVIGDGQERARLMREHPEAHFVGYQHGQALVDWYSRAEVLVFPSRTESFGLVVLEALACGVPVAAHIVMGPKDIITDGVDGFLGDDLKDAALKCLSLSPDACRTKALNYSWNHSVDTFLNNLECVG